MGGAGDDRHDATERTDPSGDRDGGRAVIGEEPAGAAQRRAQPAAPAVRRDRLLAEASPDEVPDGVTGDCTEQGGTDDHRDGRAVRRSGRAGDDQPDLARHDEVRDDQALAEHEGEDQGGEGDALGPADEVDQSIGDGRGYPDDHAGKHRRPWPSSLSEQLLRWFG